MNRPERTLAILIALTLAAGVTSIFVKEAEEEPAALTTPTPTATESPTAFGSPSPSASVAATETPSPEPTETPTVESSETPTEEPTEEPDDDVPDLPRSGAGSASLAGLLLLMTSAAAGLSTRRRARP